MKVILLQDIDKIGKMGDVLSVKEGYARNYLIPQKLAKIATPGNMKILDVLNKKKALEESKKTEEAKKLANKISELSLTIDVLAGEDEKLFGSVTNEMIQEALLQEGVNIDKKDIVLDEQIKKLGVYQVGIKIHPEVNAKLRVWVVQKK